VACHETTKGIRFSAYHELLHHLQVPLSGTGGIKAARSRLQETGHGKGITNDGRQVWQHVSGAKHVAGIGGSINERTVSSARAKLGQSCHGSSVRGRFRLGEHLILGWRVWLWCAPLWLAIGGFGDLWTLCDNWLRFACVLGLLFVELLVVFGGGGPRARVASCGWHVQVGRFVRVVEAAGAAVAAGVAALLGRVLWGRVPRRVVLGLLFGAAGRVAGWDVVGGGG